MTLVLTVTLKTVVKIVPLVVFVFLGEAMCKFSAYTYLLKSDEQTGGQLFYKKMVKTCDTYSENCARSPDLADIENGRDVSSDVIQTESL